MKKKLITLAATLLAPMLAHAGCEDMMQTWANTLHADKTLDSTLSVCKTWPANPALTLAALAFAGDDMESENGAGDLDVLVADSATGAIVAHVFQAGAIRRDAAGSADLALETARYRLAPKERAFGVRVSYDGSSRPAPYGEVTLSLYTFDGHTLRPVLDQLTVAQASGEWDTRCDGWYDSTKRTLSVGAPGAEGYASLYIAEQTVHSVSRMTKGVCVNKDGAPKRTHFTLEYRNGRYSVPKGLQRNG
ncbi:hypothetical protein P9239_21730 [Caballeronia sp. LZ062]|uniref:hypothetical protein n=1 Tax=unclassified Caballeronia TaxID=2646786 RepID=UPI00285E301A|nr:MULTISPECIES: hypothetical protein [unclassified Caballeronia]MDR5856302.1 hypothetical protein [Caballeronia sp. LZ050]MDR5872972.1 hypothetical protein [Caballeronia sp. LZ062]